MKKLFLTLVCTASLFCFAENLILVDNSRAGGQIVLPDKPAVPGKYYREFADMLNEAIFRSTGTRLPVAYQKDVKKGLIPFYIGIAPANAGKLAVGEYRIESSGSGIWCYGYDRSWSKKPSLHSDYMLGSGAAVAAFSQKYLDCFYTVPGQKTPAVKKLKTLVIPQNSTQHIKPFFKYNFSVNRSGGLPYDLHNGRFYYAWFKNYGGHSHNSAIRRNKYRKTHPEYFAMHRKKRLHPRLYGTQYCLSNPDVRKLILAEVIKQMDTGYHTVQLAQADGFHWCECSKCAVFYGKVDFKEKLWLLHRDIAAEANRLRPGKKVAILSYGPTEDPPRTFNEFPTNVIIDLAPASVTQIKKWQKMKVPGGYSAYIYNWGSYHSAGCTPKMSFSDLQKQLQMFRRYGIRGIYTCGYGELPGMEGPAYFIWNQLQLDPDKKVGELLKLYCEKTFGSGSADAVKFYRVLDSRLEKVPYALEAFDQPGQIVKIAAPELMMRRYPDQVINTLEKHLAAIEKNSGKLPAVRILRLEFEYLKHTMKVIAAYNRFFKERSDSNCRNIFNALEIREKYIKSLPNNGKVFGKVGDIPIFSGVPVKQLLDAGRLYGRIPTPFSWDFRWMRQNNVKPAGRHIAADGKKQLLFQQGLNTFSPVIRNRPTAVSCRSDANNLYVTFEGTKEKIRNFANNGFHVYLFRKQAGNWRVICGFSPQLKPWSYLSKHDASKKFKRVYSKPFKTNADPEKAVVTIVVPWKTVGGVPAAGESFGFNAVRTNKNSGTTYVWEQTQYQPKYEMRLNEFGTLTIK